MLTGKRRLLILISILLCLFFCSCEAVRGEPDMIPDDYGQSKPSISVTFLNNVEEADIWILPQTEDNLNSSLWGTPTVAKMRVGEHKACTVSNEGTGRYIVRIIDLDQAYYAASDVVLDDGYTIRFEMEETKYDASITVLDQNGNAAFVKESVFEGVFGAN